MRPLAGGIAIALGASFVSPVAAQTTEEAGMLEEVKVTGVRQSLLEADGVVDAIVAEDIGKFPDTNLAEAMQRITGVSIDRSGAGEGASLGAEGEGQKVTVRGIGSDFNLVLLNGRTMPVSTVYPTRVTQGRSFDFSNLASEAVRAVEVYKTSMANIPTGGLGATVNVLTARPLEVGERQMSFGAKAVHDTSDQDSSWTPEVSGIYSDVFADGTFGVTVSAIYQEREFGYNQAGVNPDFLPKSSLDPSWQSLPAPGGPSSENYVNLPAADENYWLPQEIAYSYNDLDRERLNGQLTLQWRPVDSLTMTLDYTYSELEIQQRGNNIAFWFIQCGQCGASFGEFTDPPVTPLFWSEDGRNEIGVGTYESGWKTELDSLGFNVEWIARDGLGFAFDAHTSSSKSGRASPFGVNMAMGLNTITTPNSRASVDFSTPFPVMSLDMPNGLVASDFRLTGASFRNSLSEMDIDQIDLSGYWDINDRQTLDFGVTLTESDNRTAFSDTFYPDWGGLGTPEDVPDDIFTLRDIRSLFDNLPGSGNPDLFNQMYAMNAREVAALREQVSGAPSRAFDDWSKDLRTKEETTSAYVQWLWNFDIGNMNSNLRAGMRYEQTDVTSTALVPIPQYIEWVANNEYVVVFGDPDFSTGEGDYDHWLPNLDFSIAVRDNMIARASYSETIGRQAWQDIQGGQTLGFLARRAGGTGEQGDPGLLPLESKNYDLSFEWYYAEGSYASVGYFFKDVANYVAFKTVSGTPYNLPHPGLGEWYFECNAATGDLNDQGLIRDCIIERYGDTQYVDADRGAIQGVPGQDPAMSFAIKTPSNANSVEVDGWEFAVQHMFGDSGFGMSANYTIVESDIAYDNNSVEDQFAIPGLSDSANIVAFYEKHGWLARLAWNWRDEFLTSTCCGGQGQPNPIYVEEYQQLDAIVSYSFENGVTLFAEGFNLTDEYSRLHGRNENMLRFITQTGPRYGVGVRWTY
jgi:TonB-dependent receptor